MKTSSLYQTSIIMLLLIHTSECLEVKDTIYSRFNKLKEYAKQRRKSSGYCSTEKFLGIGGFQGRTGNNFIQFSHGLWFADATNRTYIMPKDSDALLMPFDQTLFREMFCVVDSAPSEDSSDTVRLNTGDVYVGSEVWKKSEYLHFSSELPLFTQQMLLESLTEHTLIVNGALWGELRPTFVHTVISIIEGLFKSSLDYVAAHKRSFEGGCYEWIENDFQFEVNPNKFPTLWLGEDKADILNAANKPKCICDMSLSFVDDLCAAYNRVYKHVYLSWDGIGDISDYEAQSLHDVHSRSLLQSFDLQEDVSMLLHNRSFHVIEHRMAAEIWAVESKKEERPAQVQHQVQEQNIIVDSALRRTQHAPGRVVIGRELQHHSIHNLIDMVMAANADLFVMNPMSTWSWQVAHLRTILGLRTIPELKVVGPEGIISLWLFESNHSVVNYEELWNQFQAEYENLSDG